MGDPAPGRVVPQIAPETGSGVPCEPAPIHLTFKQMRAAYGLPEDDR